MAFNYLGTGTVVLNGCADTSRSYTIVYRFAERNVVYLCEKASRGIMEAIWIKEVNLVYSGGQYVPMYIDNLNAVYMEDELCTQQEAINSATAYLQNQINNIDNALSCPPH